MPSISAGQCELTHTWCQRRRAMGLTSKPGVKIAGNLGEVKTEKRFQWTPTAEGGRPA